MLPPRFLMTGVFALYFLGANEILLLLGAGLLLMLAKNFRKLGKNAAGMGFLPLAGIGLAAAGAAPFSLPVLFLTFLKIGSVLYGSGYVLLAFLRADFVLRLGWLTDHQLLDAVAVGQVTPGPLFTTATFIGYVLGGVPGALLATLGIFLPSFLFVALTNPLIPKIRNSAWAGAFLDGVNASALGLMAAVTLQLGASSLVDPLTIAIAAGAGILLLRFKVNSTWIILGGAGIGLLKMMLGGWSVRHPRQIVRHPGVQIVRHPGVQIVRHPRVISAGIHEEQIRPSNWNIWMPAKYTQA